MITVMSEPLRVGGRPAIGPDEPAYVIAEIGTNHNRSIDTAREMLRGVAAAGCDCAKFQIYEPDEIVSAKVRAAEYGLDRVYGDISARTMFEEHLKTPKQWFPELRDLCRELGLDFAATIHGPDGLAWAQRIGLDVVKIASMDHTNLPFLRSLVNVVQAPILISFGMAREADVAAAVQALEGHRPGVGLFHCSAVYPPKPEEIRLANIGYLRGRFQVPVGFSDHTVDTEAALAARAGGAMFFEKHVTLDHTHPGPDHPFAMEMEPLKKYMSKLKAAPLGDPSASDAFLDPSERELKNRISYVKSLISRRDLAAGELLKADDIYLARPGTGISPGDLEKALGRPLLRPVSAETPLQWADLGG